MAKKIVHFKDDNLNRQINELLSNITEENLKDGSLIMTSEDGTKYYLKVDNSGELYTEEV